jgi:hypothetical protein
VGRDVNAAVGVSTEKIEALGDYAKSRLFSDAEKVALEYAALRRRHHRRADDDHRVGERILSLQPGIPHPVARFLEAITSAFTSPSRYCFLMSRAEPRESCLSSRFSCRHSARVLSSPALHSAFSSRAS